MAKPKFYVMLSQRKFAKTRALAEAAESLGYYGVGVGDHLFVHRGDMQLPDEPLLECYTTLGAIAAVTQRVIMTQVVGANSFRNPALLAKITSTLDNISGGRFELGIGAGGCARSMKPTVIRIHPTRSGSNSSRRESR